MNLSAFEPSTRRHAVKWLKYLHYGIIQCTRGKEIYCPLNKQIYIIVFTEPDIRLCVSVNVYRS